MYYETSKIYIKNGIKEKLIIAFILDEETFIAYTV
jgi:hypothetical protein